MFEFIIFKETLLCNLHTVVLTDHFVLRDIPDRFEKFLSQESKLLLSERVKLNRTNHLVTLDYLNLNDASYRINLFITDNLYLFDKVEQPLYSSTLEQCIFSESVIATNSLPNYDTLILIENIELNKTQNLVANDTIIVNEYNTSKILKFGRKPSIILGE